MNSNFILDFWFRELNPKDWFTVSKKTDDLIRQKFSRLHQQAASGELFPWRDSAAGRLAEIIILDQFSRNIFRSTADAFSSDRIALVLAQEAVRQSVDQNLTTSEKSFLYMPFMHSESLIVHGQAIKLFTQPGLEGTLKYEVLHKSILEKFGRYPHRNVMLGRISSPEEIEFLKQPGSSF